MASTAMLERPQCEIVQRRAERERIRSRLIARPHPEDATDGIPYYDEEFDVAQSPAHHQTIQKLGEMLDRVGALRGLKSLGDNPVWYWDPDLDCQKIYYPDYAWAESDDLGSVTAKSLRLVIEVVTTSHQGKEKKDTVRMLRLNELNGVPEFLLLYPEPEDSRSLVAYRYDEGQAAYREVALGDHRRFVSQAIPGLQIEVLEHSAWSPGRKLRVWFEGEEMNDMDSEWRARQAAQRRASEADRRASDADRRASEADRRASEAELEAARLRALLRQAGIKDK